MALFLTNKENFVAGDGDFAGTQINSGNMLWSLLGSLGLVYKVLFGMHYEADRLVFRPFVPQAFQGARQLTNFKYRQAVLDIEMTGFGRDIQTITLDGQPMAGAAVPAMLTGRHALRIVLKSQAPAAAHVNRVANRFAPETPQDYLRQKPPQLGSGGRRKSLQSAEKRSGVDCQCQRCYRLAGANGRLF